MDDAEGDRRARIPGPGLRTPGRLAARPRRLVPRARTSPASPPATPGTLLAPAAPTTRRPAASRASRRSACIGNYRVFNVPTPIGHIAEHARDRRGVRVRRRATAWTSSTSPAAAPRPSPPNDAMIDVDPQRRGGRRRAGDLGRKRPRPVRHRLGRLAGLVARCDHGCGRLEHARLRPDAVGRTPAMLRRAAAASRSPAQRRHAFPGRYAFTAHRIVDVGALTGTNGVAVDRRLCGPDDRHERRDPDVSPARLARPETSRSSPADTAPSSRRPCVRLRRCGRARASSTTAQAARMRSRSSCRFPPGMITDLDGAQLRAYLSRDGGAADVTIGNAIERVGDAAAVASSRTSPRAGRPRSSTCSSPTSPRREGRSSRRPCPEFTGGSPFAVFDGTSMVGSARGRGGSAAASAPPGVDATAGEVGARVDLPARRGETPHARKRPPVTLERRRARRPAQRDETGGVHRARVDVVPGPGRHQSERQPSAPGSHHRRRRRRGDVAGGALVTGDLAGARRLDRSAGTSWCPPGGEADLVAVARGSASAKAGEDYGFILLHHGSVTRKIPYEFFVGRPQLELLQPKRLVKLAGRRDGQRPKPGFGVLLPVLRPSDRRPTTSGRR